MKRSGTEDIPNSSRNMDQSICTIQYRQESLVAVHEPLLDLDFTYWPQEAQPRELFEFQNCQPMVLCNFPELGFGENGLRRYSRSTIQSVGDDPIKHFYQKRKLLQYPAVEVIRKARRVWGVDDYPTTTSLLWCMLHGTRRVYAEVVSAVAPDHVVSGKQIIRRSSRVAIVIQYSTLSSFPTEDAKATSSGYDHCSYQNTCDHLHLFQPGTYNMASVMLTIGSPHCGSFHFGAELHCGSSCGIIVILLMTILWSFCLPSTCLFPSKNSFGDLLGLRFVFEKSKLSVSYYGGLWSRLRVWRTVKSVDEVDFIREV